MQRAIVALGRLYEALKSADANEIHVRPGLIGLFLLSYTQDTEITTDRELCACFVRSDYASVCAGTTHGEEKRQILSFLPGSVAMIGRREGVIVFAGSDVGIVYFMRMCTRRHFDRKTKIAKSARSLANALCWQ